MVARVGCDRRATLFQARSAVSVLCPLAIDKPALRTRSLATPVLGYVGVLLDRYSG